MRTVATWMTCALLTMTTACLGGAEVASERESNAMQGEWPGPDWCDSACTWWDGYECRQSCDGVCASECAPPAPPHLDCGPEDNSENWPYPGEGCKDEG